MATIETRPKHERQHGEPIPKTLSPEHQPVNWKPWPDEKPPTHEDDAPHCPVVGHFYHITNASATRMH